MFARGACVSAVCTCACVCVCVCVRVPALHCVALHMHRFFQGPRQCAVTGPAVHRSAVAREGSAREPLGSPASCPS
eukprot:8971015-Alexandrium_andersonii.AAC.1